MSALDHADACCEEAEALVAAIKAEADILPISQAKLIESRIRETQGWLQSARVLLRPPGVLQPKPRKEK